MLHTMYLFLQLRTVIRKEETSTHTFLPQINAFQIFILVMCIWEGVCVCVCVGAKQVRGLGLPPPPLGAKVTNRRAAQHGCSEQNYGLQKQQAL